ncbi:MAG: hypothetical protein ACFFBD_18265 [Candidatus Hodarchaeota archaeon]
MLDQLKLDDVDLQLLSEFQEPVSISALKGKYRLGRRSLYNRAAKLVSKGLVTYKKAGIVNSIF